LEKKGVDLHIHALKLIYNIHGYFKAEAENREPITVTYVFGKRIVQSSGSQPFMLHVPPGNVYVTGVPLV
jgi:hypothetical protein